jgi:hypothetical protein
MARKGEHVIKPVLECRQRLQAHLILHISDGQHGEYKTITYAIFVNTRSV